MRVRTGFFRVAMVVLMAAALCAPMAAQSKKAAAPDAGTAIKVDGKIIKGYIEFMAADDKEGRKSLTPGYEKTAQWAADKFKEWGVKPAGENGTYLQDVPIARGFTWTTGSPELVVEGRTFYLRDHDFTIDTTSTPGQSVDGEIVFAGYGISAPAKGLDEYAGTDVKGKVVFVLKGSPKDAPVARGMFGATVPVSRETETWASESDDQAKIKTAYDKGAAAILLFNAWPATGGPAGAAQMGQGGGRPRAVDASPFTRPFIVVSDVNERVFRQVMYRDMVHESERGLSARLDQWCRDIRDKKPHTMSTGIKAHVKGYATTVFYSERLKNNVSHNVIGKVEGTDPKLKNQYIVIGGHLDHLGVTNGVIYPGADDDASGAAMAMEMARLFATNAATIKPKRTVIFALWCGEELGLLGSEYYGDHPTDGVTMDNVVADFNNDMVGLGSGLGAPGALNFPTIFEVVMKNQDSDVARAIEPSTAGPGGSDYSAFIARGIEAFALMTSGGVGHPDYHDAGDMSAKIDPEILRKNGQFVLQGAINVANETTVNLLIPDRLHLYNGMRLAPLTLANVGASGGRGAMGGGQPGAQPAAPRFNIILNDPAAFGGNVALIDMAAKLMGVGRIEIPGRGDGTWFTANEVTDRGRAAVAEFEKSGVIPVLKNPSARLLDSMLDASKKAFVVDGLLVDGLPAMPDAALAKKINDKNALLTVEFDASAPAAVAARLIELKRLIGDSDNLLLVNGPNAVAPPVPVGLKPLQRKIDDAKQQLYLALIKAGWTKDEIYSMVGVNPPRAAGEPLQMPPPAPSRFGGNLRKLG
jgi:hypothetical protein